MSCDGRNEKIPGDVCQDRNTAPSLFRVEKNILFTEAELLGETNEKRGNGRWQFRVSFFLILWPSCV